MKKNKIIHLFPKEDIPLEVYDWFIRMEEGGFKPEDYAEFEVWARKNPDLLSYFPEIERAWQHMSAAELDVPVKMKKISGVKFSNPKPKVSRHVSQRPFALAWMPSYLISGLAGVFMISLVAIFTIRSMDSEFPSYQTVGQQRHFITLADGTRVQLNSSSKISVDYTEQERTVYLEKGEAYFSVAKDKNRPFVVRSGEAGVKAIGTAFNVKRVEERHSAVTLVEGVIEVSRINDGKIIGSTAMLSDKGKQAVLFSADNDFNWGSEHKQSIVGIHISDVNAEEVISWKDDKLIFSGERLKTAIDTFNRYASHQLVLLDDTVSSETIFGVFKMGDWESAVRAIESAYPIEAKQISQGKTHLVAVK